MGLFGYSHHLARDFLFFVHPTSTCLCEFFGCYVTRQALQVLNAVSNNCGNDANPTATNPTPNFPQPYTRADCLIGNSINNKPTGKLQCVSVGRAALTTLTCTSTAGSTGSPTFVIPNSGSPLQLARQAAFQLVSTCVYMYVHVYVCVFALGSFLSMLHVVVSGALCMEKRCRCVLKDVPLLSRLSVLLPQTWSSS